MQSVEDFKLYPGALLKGAHLSFNLREILDVYSPNEYELLGGRKLPEQRPKLNGFENSNGNAPKFIPGKVIEQTKTILLRGDQVEDLREYLENAKSKMPGKFKNSVQSILILASRQGRVNCACVLIDDYSADVNAVSNVKKHSPLHFAAYNGDKVLAQELLSRGANKTLTNVYDETPAQTAHNQMENDGGNEMKRQNYEECRDLIDNFTLTTETSSNRPVSGLETLSTYVPTSKSGAIVDTYQTLSRRSMALFNKVTDDNETKMLKLLQALVPTHGFTNPNRTEKFEVRHFKLMVENLWKAAIMQPVTAGLYAGLGAKLHDHFSGIKTIVNVLSTNSGKFYPMVFDEKKMLPLFDTEAAAYQAGARLVNFKRELLQQCQKQFNSERDLARFRREIDWDSITDEFERRKKEKEVMYARNKAQDLVTANVIFIGQLYNHGLATTSIIKIVVEELIPESRIAPESVRNNEDKEVLTDYIAGLENDVTMLVKLIEVIGQKFEKSAGPSVPAGPAAVGFEKRKRDADRRKKLLSKWFKGMKRTSDRTKTGAEGEICMQNRVLFAVKDLVELRQRGWMTRGLAEAKGKKGPTTDDDGWTAVGSGASSPIARNSSEAVTRKKRAKKARKAEKARLAALARATEEAARRTEINKEAQKLADDLRSIDADSERVRVQIAKHMNGPKQARQRQKMNARLRKNKTERNKIKQCLKAARAKGPDPEEEKPKEPEKENIPDIIMPEEGDFFELPQLGKNENRVKGMLNEFQMMVDFAEFSLSLQEMKLEGDEQVASVVLYILMYASESLSSSTKRKNLDDVIALLKHLLTKGDVNAAQLALSKKALDCLIDDIKMDAPLAGKVYDEIMAAVEGVKPE